MKGRAQGLRPWQVVFDVGLAAAVTVLALAEVWVPFEPVLGQGSAAQSTIPILIVGILLALRRVWPLALVGVFLTWLVVAILYQGQIYLLFNGQIVPFMIALFSAARQTHSRATTWIVAGVGALTLLFADLFIPELQSVNEIVFHWTVCLLAFAIGWGLRASEDKAVNAALAAQRAADLAEGQAAEAVREERVRIARELHDVLAHTVSVMVVQAGAAESLVDSNPAATRQALERIRETGNDALDEVRGLVSLWRAEDAPTRAPQPGLESLDDLVAATGTPNLVIDVHRQGELDRVPPGMGLAAYRIVQEALTNVRKHSDASTARVRVSAEPSLVTVEVTDDGTAGRDAGSGGNGIVGMRERVAMYGGRFEAGPTESGYRVRAELPRSVPT